MFLPQTPQQATAASGAATLNTDAGIVTTESLSTAAGATYTLTLGCNQATVNSVILATMGLGSSSQGDPTLSTVSPGNGVITFVVTNRHATLALNGTLKIRFGVLN